MSTGRRFLVTTWEGGGCVPPALHLGVRLARRGHEVLVVGWQTQAAKVAACDLPFAGYPSLPPWPEDLAQEEDWDRLREMLHGPATEHDILAAAKRFQPDTIVVDCMMAAAFRAAATLDLPAAVLVHLLYQPYATQVERIAPGAGPLLAAAARVLALTPPGLDADGPLPPRTRYVGPITHPDPPPAPATLSLPELAEAGDPWVLLSLSTTQMGQARALPPLLEALAGLPVRVLLTLGDVLPADAISVPGNVTARGYVPHTAVLPYMTGVLCHGGLSTITAALAAGVPLVIAPQGRDQRRNAEQAAAAGVSRTIPDGATPRASRRHGRAVNGRPDRCAGRAPPRSRHRPTRPRCTCHRRSRTDRHHRLMHSYGPPYSPLSDCGPNFPEYEPHAGRPWIGGDGECGPPPSVRRLIRIYGPRPARRVRRS